MISRVLTVQPGRGIFDRVPSATADPLHYFRRYDQLYHNTDEAGARGIIQSGMIWARPIQDFGHEDQEEYRHGLVVLRDGLVRRIADLEAWMPDFPNFLSIRKYGITVVDLARRIEAYVVREIEAFDSGKPYLQIFIACFSKGQANGKFGTVQLSMSPLLPIVAYAHPTGAFASGISRVTYSDEELLSYAVDQLAKGQSMLEIQPLLEVGKLDQVAARLAVEFMVLAPNLKRETYSQESEWRLKVIFQDLPELQAKNPAHLNRSRIGCQLDPVYTTHEPRRLVHPLSIDGRGIINGVRLIDATGATTKSFELDQLRLTYCMPQTNALNAAQIIKARGLTAGNATFVDLNQAIESRND